MSTVIKKTNGYNGHVSLWKYILPVFLLGGVFVAWFWLNDASDELSFDDAVVYATIDQEALFNQIKPISEAVESQNTYIQPALYKMQGYLREMDLGFENVLPLLKKKVRFALMPENNDTNLPFVLIFEKKNISTDIDGFFSEFEPVMENDFNVASENYRQVEFFVFNSLSSQPWYYPQTYAVALVDEYVVVTNSTELMKDILDRIIDQRG